MSLLDLKVAHQVRNRESATQWKERDRRLKNLTDPITYTPIINVAESIGIQQQQIMDEELWKAAKNGDVDNFITCLEKFSKDNDTPLSTIFSQLTVPDQDTFLHVAASYGHEDLACFIANHFFELLTCRNHKGDSALHLAARAGHLGVVVMLLRVKQEKESNETQENGETQVDGPRLSSHLKEWGEGRIAVNNDGNTALHEAMLYDHKDVATCLVESNVEAAYYVNKQGKSPLYMAVESSNIEYVRNILGRSEYMHLLDEQLIKGKSLLHAAIRIKSIAILREIVESKPMLIHFRDENGISPLNFASSTRFLEGAKFLEDWLKQGTIDTDAVNVNNEFHTREIPIEDIRQSELQKKEYDRLHDLKRFQKVNISPEGRPQLGWDQTMSLELYECAKNGNIDNFFSLLSLKNFPPSAIYNPKTPLQNTFLHVAASFGNEDLAGFIAHHFRSFLIMKNHRGDTALHMAAGAGHLGVVEILLKFQIEQMRKDSLPDVDMQSSNETAIEKFKKRVQVNDDGNTPLHEALMNNHENVAEYLIKAKIEDAYYVNKQGKSALFMAIEANNIDFVKTILRSGLFYAYQHIIYEEVIKGKSLVHATIKSRNIVLLKEITKMKTTVIQIKDEKGQTPLHYAASTNFAEGVEFLLDKHKMDIIEKDADGLLPIHCASKYGHVGILTKLLQNCLDAREFVNQDGQNIIHVAAKYGKYGVVRYILKTPGLELLLNEKDKEGNTPLHLAAINWHPKVVSCLTWDKRVDLKLVNNEGFTALDVAEENMEGITSYRQRLTWTALKSAGAGRSMLKKKPKLERLKSAKIEPYNMEHWKDRVNTLLLVSTLIATVTFAAAFTMPGGYNDSEPDHGLATLLNKLIFQAFVIFDNIAMYSAILMSVSLMWAQLGDLTLVINSLRLAVPLLGISLTMMSLAFMAAVYVVISKLVWLSLVCFILGLISLACLSTLFFPFILPISSKYAIPRYLSYYSFCLLMLGSGCYFDPDVENNYTPFRWKEWDEVGME